MGAGHGRGRLVHTSCWDLYLQVGLPFEKCKGTALTRSGDTERPVPEASSRPGSTLFVSFYLLINLFIFSNLSGLFLRDNFNLM